MQERESDERITTFTGRLAMLEPGERARLKRDAGKTIAEAQNMGLFYRLLRDVYGLNSAQEELYFLVATLYPLAENSAKEDSFGATLHKVRAAKERVKEPIKSMDRRMEVLLDADASQLPFRMRQAVKFLKSVNKEASINWQRLLEDLLKWNWPSRTVQKQWAHEYFAPRYPKPESQETTPDQ